MNGKKVLNRLISLFLIINIVLFGVNCVNRSNEYLLSQERVNNIVSLFKKRGIQIDAELMRDYRPKYTANLSFIGDSVAVRDKVVKSFFGNDFAYVKRSTALSSQNLGRNILYYTFGNEILAFDHTELSYKNMGVTMDGPKPGIESAKLMCNQLIKRIIPEDKNLTYNIEQEAYDTYWKLTYYPVIEEIPILDSYMEFIVANGGVVRANMYIANVEIQNNSKQDIYAVDLVLFGIENYMLENGYTNIEEIAMCYKREKDIENVLGEQIIPVYKIKINGLNQEIFVNAYTNQILE